MSNRTIKIIVDAFMLVFIALSLVRWDGDPTFHIVVGGVCSALFSIHVFLNRKWLFSVTKTLKSGKANSKTKWQYIVDLLLIIVWGISIITGFLSIAPYLNDVWVFARDPTTRSHDMRPANRIISDQ